MKGIKQARVIIIVSTVTKFGRVFFNLKKSDLNHIISQESLIQHIISIDYGERKYAITHQ